MLATQDSFGKEGLGKNLKRKHTSSAENDSLVLILRYRIAHSHDVSTDSFDLRPAVMLDRTFLGSLMAYGLIETIFSRDLFADAVKPVVHKWLAELNELSRDLKGQKLKDIDFQARLEDLYRRVNLAELVTFIDLDRLTRNLKYPAKGAAIMSGVAQLIDIIPGMKYHHEKWGGGGYPEGLKGEEIPLQARIVTVADTFDAMTTTRP